MKNLLFAFIMLLGLNMSGQDMKMDLDKMYPKSMYMIKKDLLHGQFEPIGIVEKHWDTIFFRKDMYGRVELIRIKKKKMK